MAVQILALQQRATANDANGNPLPAAKVYTYVTGTTTPLTTYTTSALSVANANPIVADAAGRFGPIYTNGASAVKVVIETAAGAAVDTIDPAPFVYDSSAGASSISYSPNATIPDDNVQDALDTVADLIAAGFPQPVAASSSAANVITLTTEIGYTSQPPDGTTLTFIAPITNTSTVTVIVDGLAAQGLRTVMNTLLPADYILSGNQITITRTGVVWMAVRPPDSGTAAAGQWCRHADGTMTVRRQSVFDGASNFTWNFPKAFSGVPTSVQCLAEDTTAGRICGYTNLSNTAVELAARTVVGGLWAGNFSAQAEGRWYAL